jgi:hypothetical protein
MHRAPKVQAWFWENQAKLSGKRTLISSNLWKVPVHVERKLSSPNYWTDTEGANAKEVMRC